MKTDFELKQDVIAELTREPSVDASQIRVEVERGIVTLAGHIGSYTAKVHAERAAQRVSGVKALAVEMDVKLPGLNKQTDTDIATSAENVLQWNSCLPDSVKIKAENGWITLSGDVEWDYQRRGAEDAVRHLLGVTGVSDETVIKPKTLANCVKSDIEAALQGRTQAEAQDISVEVRGPEVTLAGTVHSESERELAASSAEATPGVRDVIDNITIAS